MSNLNTAYQPLVQSNEKKLNIPVDVNSKIPLELRWNDELTAAPESPLMEVSLVVPNSRSLRFYTCGSYNYQYD